VEVNSIEPISLDEDFTLNIYANTCNGPLLRQTPLADVSVVGLEPGSYCLELDTGANLITPSQQIIELPEEGGCSRMQVLSSNTLPAPLVCSPRLGIKTAACGSSLRNQMDKNKIDLLRQLIEKSDDIVFFGGAGVSTASGIPDFRSATGLYNLHTGSRYDRETILSHSFFVTHPNEFYDYHLNHLVAPNAKPNPAHYALVELERKGKLKAIITQNIDGLHQKAGSTSVLELHGNAFDFYCLTCRNHFDLDFIQAHRGLPRCSHCGGIVRPNVVLYEEPLNPQIIDQAVDAIQAADLLIVGGTSLVVYPAAGLIDYYSGKDLVLINRNITSYDSRATLLWNGDIAEILPAAVN
jgi:NAD-dependent deacetylase